MRSKLLVKGLSNFDQEKGTIDLSYTFLLWLNCKGAPKEILNRLLKEKITYRIGIDSEENFTPQNSNIREKDGLITVTYRGMK
jgi:hypothetical protein